MKIRDAGRILNHYIVALNAYRRSKQYDLFEIHLEQFFSFFIRKIFMKEFYWSRVLLEAIVSKCEEFERDLNESLWCTFDYSYMTFIKNDCLVLLKLIQ
jgi:hypothetical protein